MRTPPIRWLRLRRDVDGLLAALHYTRIVSSGDGERVDLGTRVRRRALEALAPFAVAEDVPAIGVALDDNDPEIRRLALRIVQSLEPSLAADALARSVVAPSQPRFALARMESLEVLLQLARNGERGMVRRLAIAATESGPVAALDELTRDALRSVAETASPPDLSALVDELIERLPSMNGSLENAQAVLVWLAPHSTQPLIDALDYGSGARGALAGVLGEIRDSKALDALVAALEDDRAEVRRASVWALGELRDPRAAEALMRATMDDAFEIRRQAAEALDAMGSIAFMAGVATMIRSLEDRAQEQAVARLVTESLERGPSTSGSDTREQGGQRWAPSFVERLELPRREA